MGTALTIFHPPVNCLYTLETDIIIRVIFYLERGLPT